MKNKSLLFILCLFYVAAEAQTEARASFFQIEIGLCASLDYCGNHIPVVHRSLPSNVPVTYLRPTASVLWAKFLREHFFFSSGVEYAVARYYLPWASDATHRATDFVDLRDVRVDVHTFSIPVYANWTVLHKKIFLGVGPAVDIFPYSPVIGTRLNVSTGEEEGDWTGTGLIKKCDLSINARMGFVFSIGTQSVFMEARLKHGVFPLLSDAWRHADRYWFSCDPPLFNDFCMLSFGYILK